LLYYKHSSLTTKIGKNQRLVGSTPGFLPLLTKNSYLTRIDNFPTVYRNFHHFGKIFSYLKDCYFILSSTRDLWLNLTKQKIRKNSKRFSVTKCHMECECTSWHCLFSLLSSNSTFCPEMQFIITSSIIFFFRSQPACLRYNSETKLMNFYCQMFICFVKL
jgi:hypothetical protein